MEGGKIKIKVEKMKNKAGFYVKSRNCELAIEQGKKPIANFKKSDLEQSGFNWWSCGVEWHHNGAYIMFFETDGIDSHATIEIIREACEENVVFSTKKEALDYVLKLPKWQDSFQGVKAKIHLKSGKYGLFVCGKDFYKSDKDDIRACDFSTAQIIESMF